MKCLCAFRERRSNICFHLFLDILPVQIKLWQIARYEPTSSKNCNWIQGKYLIFLIICALYFFTFYCILFAFLFISTWDGAEMGTYQITCTILKRILTHFKGWCDLTLIFQSAFVDTVGLDHSHTSWTLLRGSVNYFQIFSKFPCFLLPNMNVMLAWALRRKCSRRIKVVPVVSQSSLSGREWTIRQSWSLLITQIMITSPDT